MSFRSDISIGSDKPFLRQSSGHSIELTHRKTTLGELMDEDHRIIDISRTPTAAMLVLSFQNLTYAVKPRRFCGIGEENDKALKILLNDISGETRDGEIMAVVGASGSGKSTLIDALAGRIARESLRGSLKLNGEAIESNLLKVISAYVMQDDLLFPMLTVEETLMFSAEFRLPRAMSMSQKKARVLTLIDQLGLRSAAQTVIGDEGHRGVSGGERRRVSIGMDIIHDPIILFLDEPTSGLDSTSAFMVVKVLQRIAESGSIVIMSIHQPSYRILSLLSHMIILSTGKIVFSGSPASIPSFFAEFGNPIPVNSDRIEFALDFITELESSPSGNNNLSDFYQTWKKSNRRSLDVLNLSLSDAITASISRGKLVSGTTDSEHISSSVPKYANPIWKEVIIIAKRSITNSNRAPELFATRFAAVLITGIILATTFWGLDNSPKGVKEKVGFFAFAISTTFYTCAEALPVFLLQRYIFIRETSRNSYRRVSFVLSHALISIPSLLILSLVFSATTFWAVGLSGGTIGFLSFFGFTMAAFWAGSSLVTFLSGIIVNLMMAYTIVVALLAYFLLFSGFFISRNRIPNYLIWFHYISLVKYPYQGVMQNEFDDPLKCLVRGVQVFDESPLKSAPDSLKLKLLESAGSVLGMNITSSTCLTTGVDILNQSGVTDIGKWNCLLITIFWGFFFRVLFYFTLLIWSKNKRR